MGAGSWSQKKANLLEKWSTFYKIFETIHNKRYIFIISVSRQMVTIKSRKACIRCKASENISFFFFCTTVQKYFSSQDLLYCLDILFSSSTCLSWSPPLKHRKSFWLLNDVTAGLRSSSKLHYLTVFITAAYCVLLSQNGIVDIVALVTYTVFKQSVVSISCLKIPTTLVPVNLFKQRHVSILGFKTVLH